MIRHPLRFILGLYPILGWLLGLESYNHYPQFYIAFTLAVFIAWIMYENAWEYLEFGGEKEIIKVNALGIVASLSVFYLINTNFPLTITQTQVLPLIYLCSYLIYGLIENLH